MASGDRSTDTREQLDHFAKCIGLAFQVQDDILDVEGDTATIGKPQGSDAVHNKPTYPNLLGLQAAKETATRLYDEAVASLSMLRGGATLRALADYIVKRDK